MGLETQWGNNRFTFLYCFINSPPFSFYKGTGCTGGNTVPTGSIYRRTRSITIRSDSNTVSAGGSSRRDSGYTTRAGSNTVLSERKTVRSIGHTWWMVAALVVAVLVYRLYRKVFR